MTRPTERLHRCTDLELLLPIKEQGYRSLLTTAGLLGVDYTVLRRVVHGQACTEAEEASVRQAWASYGPDAVYEMLEQVLGEQGGPVHGAYRRQLRIVVQRLMDQVLREVER